MRNVATTQRSATYGPKKGILKKSGKPQGTYDDSMEDQKKKPKGGPKRKGTGKPKNDADYEG